MQEVQTEVADVQPLHGDVQRVHVVPEVNVVAASQEVQGVKVACSVHVLQFEAAVHAVQIPAAALA